jgi:hypothetical protein
MCKILVCWGRLPVDITAAVTMTWYHNVILTSAAAAADVIQYNLLLIYVLNQQPVAIYHSSQIQHIIIIIIIIIIQEKVGAEHKFCQNLSRRYIWCIERLLPRSSRSFVWQTLRPPTSVIWLQLLHKLKNTGIYDCRNTMIYAHTTSYTPATCDTSLCSP